jgi:hypothetical protein
MVVGED